jgi:hypothetical protein
LILFLLSSQKILFRPFIAAVLTVHIEISSAGLARSSLGAIPDKSILEILDMPFLMLSAGQKAFSLAPLARNQRRTPGRKVGFSGDKGVLILGGQCLTKNKATKASSNDQKKKRPKKE